VGNGEEEGPRLSPIASCEAKLGLSAEELAAFLSGEEEVPGGGDDIFGSILVKIPEPEGYR
jgi:hypothetical protein